MNLPPIDIPVIGIGPGTQTRAEDEMEILKLPTGSMNTFSNPILPEPEDVQHLQQGVALLGNILTALKNYTTGSASIRLELHEIESENLDLVNQALGEGEVSLRVDGDSPIVAQESVLAGVWRVQQFDSSGELIDDCIEVCDIPEAVKTSTFSQTTLSFDSRVTGPEPEMSNAPSVLVEIADHAVRWTPASAPHVINLTLLPISDAELLFLGAKVGTGPTTILSRGYGNCRIGSTAINNVWWIKYYNSEDTLILNTIEISGIPEVALAAQEDIDGSAHRLDEILDLYR